MTLNITMPEQDELKPRIAVFGVGGAGGNAVNNMIEKELEGVEFIVANTDSQALQGSRADVRIQIGAKVTEGLGAGARPSVGAAAAEETIEQIVDQLAGAHMCFITAGMGGGTGTGAAPIIAQAARELGVLTVGVVTKPFQFEGAKRMRQAEAGVEQLQKMVDTLIIIPNQNLFRLANERTTFTEAFSLADDVLYQGVKGVTDLMVRPGLINLDFADVRAVMDEMGKAMMGTGESEGEERAVQAAEKAIANPLLDEISLRGAKGVLINITGGYDLTLFELDEAANRIREEVDPEANIIVGSTLDPEMEGIMRVSVVATGIDASEVSQETPMPRRRLANAAPAQPAVEAAPVVETAIEEPSAAFELSQESAVVQDIHEDEEEMSLFADIHEPIEEVEPVENVASMDDLPPPAYQPAPAASTTVEPSAETMARLRAAAEKEPQERPQPMRIGEPLRAAQEDQDQKPRFGGINSLISRISGHGHEEPPVKRPAVAPVARQRTALHAEEEDQSPEQDRVEIPAFLRRQAN